MPSLTVVVDGVDQKIRLESTAVTLGRGLESDVRLKDIKASRRHCQVVKTPKGFQCVDLSSGNGTYVNGVQIKAQILNHGDRITIGSTTIVFEDAPKPVAVSTKAPTAKIPMASAPAPASGPVPVPAKSASSKIATAKVPVAPTRRTTERLEAVKPAAKSGPVPAVKTGRPVKASGRASSVRSSRPPAEAPAKKKSPVLFIAAGVVVLGLAAGGYFLFGRGDNGDQIKDQVEQFMKKGKAAEAKGNDDAAVAEYRKALDLCQGDRYKIRASEISKLIAQIEGHKGGTTAPPKPDPKETPDKADAFPAKKAEIAEKHKLAGPGADWAGALKEWTEFAGRKPPAEGAAKAFEEIKAIQGRAREELAGLRRKADALARENKMAEAVDLLKQQAARFEGTEAQSDLEAAIKQYDK